jgi:V8-like Glu-specific endopeptidase
MDSQMRFKFVTADDQSNSAYLPLTPSQLALRDDIDATEPVPAELAHRFSHRRVYLPGDAHADLAAHLKQRDDVAGHWELELPGDSVVGLPGRTAELLDPKSIPEDLLGKTHLDAFRPPWVGHVFQPRLSGLPDAPPTALRTIEGRRVRPAYGVYGADNRVPYRPSGYPWGCIGRVFTWTDASAGPSWAGAGVLVGPRHVLTAGHMAPWGSPHWKMLFVPGYYDGRSVVGSGADSWVSDFRSLDSGADTVSAHDMSILRLYDPLGDGLGYFGSKTYDRAWQDQNVWTLVGYPDAVTNERPSYETGIAVLDNDVDGGAMELEHHGDVTPGDSGGPFFGIWPDGYPYVIGTVSGGEAITGQDPEDNNICAGGQDLSDLISYWRTNWP